MDKSLTNNGLCYCKVNEILHPSYTLDFKYGECYKYKYEGSVTDTNFVYYNHSYFNGNGFRFYLKTVYNSQDLLFDDYFCTLKEIRKLKLQKIEN